MKTAEEVLLTYTGYEIHNKKSILEAMEEYKNQFVKKQKLFKQLTEGVDKDNVKQNLPNGRKAPLPPSPSPEIFKQGDKITLNTGYKSDNGIVIVDYGNVVFWEDKNGSRYCSPRNKYNITLQK